MRGQLILGGRKMMKQAFVARCLAIFFVFIALGAAQVFAQDVNAGKALYNAVLVPGNPNCASGGCHGPNPLDRQNKIQNGDTPGGIGFAISSVRSMSFLRGRLSAAELTDLAAYIANPTAASGAPAIDVMPLSISFPTVGLGQSSAPIAVTVSNSGTATLAISSVLSNGAEFVVSSTNCQSVVAGGSCTFNVTFTPQSAGARSGSITISHNATGTTTSISVSGNATQPSLNASVSSVDFGFVAGGAPNASRTVTITNATNVAITLTELRVTSANFVITGGTCSTSLTLSAGQNCDIIVKYDARESGIRSGELIVASNFAPTISTSLTGEWVFIPPGYKLVIEYRFVPLDYYFITSRPTEQQLLEGLTGFERTGERFFVFEADATPAGSRAALTRFFFDRIARKESRGSHFYTLLDDERKALRSQNPSNAPTPRLPFDEGTDSWAALPVVPGVGGRCATGLLPVYRLFRGNVRFPDDPNHRFTVRTDIYNDFVARGWDGEGVRFCVPAN